METFPSSQLMVASRNIYQYGPEQLDSNMLEVGRDGNNEFMLSEDVYMHIMSAKILCFS